MAQLNGERTVAARAALSACRYLPTRAARLGGIWAGRSYGKRPMAARARKNLVVQGLNTVGHNAPESGANRATKAERRAQRELELASKQTAWRKDQGGRYFCRPQKTLLALTHAEAGALGGRGKKAFGQKKWTRAF